MKYQALKTYTSSSYSTIFTPTAIALYGKNLTSLQIFPSVKLIQLITFKSFCGYYVTRDGIKARERDAAKESQNYHEDMRGEGTISQQSNS